jgi:hypothetical protein
MHPLSRFYLCFALISFFIQPIAAQKTKKETPQYKNAFKGYLNLLDGRKTTIITDDTSFRETIKTHNRALLPTIGWSKYRKNGRFTEIGITRMKFDYDYKSKEWQLLFYRDTLGNFIPIQQNVIIPETEIWTNTVGLRFEWNFPFFHEEGKRFQSFLGISTDPTLSYQKINTVFTSFYSSRVLALSNSITVIPRITYALSNRFFLDINAPISFITLNVNYKVDKNPTLPSYARETVNFRAHLPTTIWAIRFGIGYRI